MPVDIENKVTILPALALRGLVAFPNNKLTFDVIRKKSIAALNKAMETNHLIFLVTQKELYVEEPIENDVYKIGCVARISQVLKTSGSGFKVCVDGLFRAEQVSLNSEGDYLSCATVPCEIKEPKHRDVYKESVLRRIRAQFERYISVCNNVAPDVVMTVASCDDIGFLSDYIAFNVPAPYDDKQYILEQLSTFSRAKILIEMLDKEREIIEIDNKISEKARAAIDENQKDYYLREQMRAISSELYGDDSADEVDTYRDKILGLNADESVKNTLYTEVNKLAKMPQGSHEGTVVREYLDTCLELPWNHATKTLHDVKKSEKILERDFYGMKKVKERILEMLSVYALAPDIKGQIICLVGPPGVGKTSIGKTLAECMGRNFARVSLGGVHDEAEIRGHRKTYIGSMPGKIIHAFKQAKTSNPLIMLDEIDKVGNDYKGDPASALLEVLDSEQNKSFVDHYIEIPYDLSNAVFIATANTLDTIPRPLLDRMEVIELTGYTREEKFKIAKKHLVAREMSRHGLSSKTLKINDSAIYSLIDFYTREAGVRNLEREIASLCRKSAKMLVNGEAKKVTLSDKDVEKMLGKKRFKPEVILDHDEVGIINGLAWTAVGGEIMQLEVSAMTGTGKIELTGSLGDVMKESAKAAVSYVRSNASHYGISETFYKDTDIHIHATEAAIPKDGPSAGVTMTTAIISALTNRPIRRDIAMTGEVTIRGRVLPIGGLKEKSMAAYRGGVKTVFIPNDNIADIDEIDEEVKANVKFVPVSYVDQIIKYALSSEEKTENSFYDHAILNQKVDTIRQ